MKTMQSIALFLILALLNITNSANLKTENTVKTSFESHTQIMTSSEQSIFSVMWQNLFQVPRGTACRSVNLLAKIRNQLIEEGLYPGMKNKVQKGKFWWVKQWGYEASAYFFDYLDPVLRNDTVKAFESVYTSLRAQPQVNTEIPDPFDFKKMMALGSDKLTKKQQKMIKKFTENYDAASFEVSANLPQIQSAINKWKWPTRPGDPTYFRRFIQEYDMNYDGRLNPREFILASIWHNKQIVGSSLCENCYFEIGKTLDAIFLYLDCDNDGLLSAQEIWGNLPNIQRNTEKWNMYAMGNDQSIRTAAVNDFILKNSKIKQGFISRNEFRVGILLGFWDRQTETTKILKDESRTLKNLRWEEGDMIDIALYSYYKKKMMSGQIK